LIDLHHPLLTVRRAPWFLPAVALALLVAFVIVFEICTRGYSVFIKPENLVNVLRQWSDRGVIAIGMTLVITLGGIDLSVGSLAALLGGIGIYLMNRSMAHEVPELAAVAIAFVVMLCGGAAAGAINGLLITRGRIAPFMATLGGLAAYRSLATVLVEGGEYRSSSAHYFNLLGAGGIPIPGTNIAPRAPEPIPLLIPWPVLIFALVAFIGWIILNRARLGRYILAVGANEQAAIYSGVNTRRVQCIAYILLGFCTGIGAMILSSRLNSISSSQSGQLYELDVIAAVVIGGTRLRGGAGTIAGTIIGILILGVLGNMLNLLQVSIHWQNAVKGAIIVAAALLQRAE
jgi:ribose transport system permease protein